MRLEVLSEFQELCHSLSFSSAAKNLHISQPNLSKHISALEKELGFSLFEDSSKTRLTPAGKSYLDAVCRMLLIHNVAIEEGKRLAAQRTREVRVLLPVIQNEGTGLLNNALHEFSNGDPSRRVVFLSGKDRSTLENVYRDYVDLAVVTANRFFTDDLMEKAERKGIGLVPMVTSGLVVWVHSSSSLAGKDFIAWEDLKEVSLTFAAHKSFNDIRYASTNMLVEAGIFPRCALSVRPVKNAEEFFANIGANDVCLMSEGMAKNAIIALCPGREIIPIREDTAYWTFFLAYQQKNASKDVAQIINTIKLYASEAIEG